MLAYYLPKMISRKNFYKTENSRFLAIIKAFKI